VCVLHCRYHEFEPTDVGVVVLPNGQRAVTYTRQSQTGHGDHREANVEIDKIIRKTKHLQVPSRVCVYVCVCVCVCVCMLQLHVHCIDSTHSPDTWQHIRSLLSSPFVLHFLVVGSVR